MPYYPFAQVFPTSCRCSQVADGDLFEGELQHPLQQVIARQHLQFRRVYALPYAAVSYANNIELSNGLVVDSKCPNATMTGLGCTVTTNSGNQDNLVYVSYVVSDVGSLLVGSYQQSIVNLM